MNYGSTLVSDCVNYSYKSYPLLIRDTLCLFFYLIFVMLFIYPHVCLVLVNVTSVLQSA
jgi:hypothetical protein